MGLKVSDRPHGTNSVGVAYNLIYFWGLLAIVE